MVTHEAALVGARQIIQRCLNLSGEQELLVFADEATIEVAAVIVEAAHDLGVPHTIVFVPITQQRLIPRETFLSSLTLEAAKEARAILTCVNGMPECLPFRDYLLESHWGAHNRIGHMPGATMAVLTLANVNFDRLVADCHNLELAMARGRQIELISYDRQGAMHTLVAEIGGWDRLPVASTGIIRDGSWGNVPSGETYIAPMEGTAEGTIAITGSLPGLLINHDAQLILHFVRGNLAHIEPEESDAARWLIDTHIQVAQTRDDQNWSNLAEIGIGLNPAVTELTGEMLYDEKAADTAHIAIGSNRYMGGMVDSEIHCDMVTRRPTIRVDGKTIVEHGQLHFRETDWRENHRHVILERSQLRNAVEIGRSGIQTDLLADGRLRRELRPEPGHLSHCFIGDDETAQIAGTVERRLPAEGDWVSIRRIASRSALEFETVRRVLHVMWDYGLIKIRPQEGA